MNDYSNGAGCIAIPIADLVRLVSSRPGITTPDVAGHFNISVTYARWAIHQVDALEFYDGNHIRIKAGE